MKRADRLGVEYVLIVGDKEIAEGTAALRNMKTKEQMPLTIDDIVAGLKEKLGI